MCTEIAEAWRTYSAFVLSILELIEWFKCGIKGSVHNVLLCVHATACA